MQQTDAACLVHMQCYWFGELLLSLFSITKGRYHIGTVCYAAPRWPPLMQCTMAPDVGQFVLQAAQGLPPLAEASLTVQ